MTFNGVIDKITGDLLRGGFCDFTNDGSFDPAIEEIKTDIPRPAKVRADFANDKMHRWNGDAWILVDQISPTA